VFCLVCFDIVDNRMRNRTVKVLKEYGQRVQKSVFECSNLSEEQFVSMKNRIEDCTESTQDTIRFYFICRKCLVKMEYSGIGEPPSSKDYRVV
jgi:CRISPR-associated protein Cas2